MEIQELHIQRCSTCKKYLYLSDTKQNKKKLYCVKHSLNTSKETK